MVRAHPVCAPAPRTPRMVPSVGSPVHGMKTKAVLTHDFPFAKGGLEAHCYRILECPAMLCWTVVRFIDLTGFPPKK